jgi:hypothetical protein
MEKSHHHSESGRTTPKRSERRSRRGSEDNKLSKNVAAPQQASGGLLGMLGENSSLIIHVAVEAAMFAALGWYFHSRATKAEERIAELELKLMKVEAELKSKQSLGPVSSTFKTPDTPDAVSRQEINDLTHLIDIVNQRVSVLERNTLEKFKSMDHGHTSYSGLSESDAYDFKSKPRNTTTKVSFTEVSKKIEEDSMDSLISKDLADLEEN